MPETSKPTNPNRELNPIGLTLSNVGFQRRGNEERFRFDLHVPTGAWVLVQGPSGAGKSTLLDLIAGFEHPQSGQVTWMGEDITGLDAARRPINMLFQEHNLFPHLSVERNIALGFTSRVRLSRADKGRIGQALDDLGLSEFSGRLPGQLSGGQQQRVGLARCLLRDRPLLLLDEPFSALDSDNRDNLMRLLSAIKKERGWTIMMVSHDPAPLSSYATHKLNVAGGQASLVEALN